MGILFRRAMLIWWLACCASAAGAADVAETQRLEVALLGAADSPAARGAALGIAEANAQGRYFKREFELVFPASPSELPTQAVVIAAVPASTLREASREGRLVINAVAHDDALRDECALRFLHTAPSARMVADARRQADEAEVSTDQIEAWHPSLVRFAARDLNKRYRDRFEEPMGSEAWAGWAAARVIGEAALRGEGAGAAEIEAFLRERLRFDGQKGTSLTFRANGQLRQPLYLVVHGKVVGEAPLREVVPDRDLDSLGRTDCGPQP